jgi:hypothetical protein
VLTISFVRVCPIARANSPRRFAGRPPFALPEASPALPKAPIAIKASNATTIHVWEPRISRGLSGRVLGSAIADRRAGRNQPLDRIEMTIKLIEKSTRSVVMATELVCTPRTRCSSPKSCF